MVNEETTVSVEYNLEGESVDSPVEGEDCKQPKYIAIYFTDEGLEKHLTACTVLQLKKALEEIPFDHICCVWKGKPKEIKSKSVVTF